MNSRRELNHLIVIGGGVIETHEESYYVKAAVARYLNELATYFPQVSFIGVKNSGARQYTTKLDSEIIKPIPYTIKTLLFIFIGLFIKMLRSSKKNTAVLLYTPQMPLLPIMPFLRLLSSRFIVYVAGDWIEIAEELKLRRKGWRVPMDNASVTFPLRWADAVLVRGAKLLKQVKRYNSRVIESLPIVPWDSSQVERSDSCKGNHINLLYVGKLLKGKGLTVILDSMKIICSRKAEQFHKIKLNVVGSGADDEELRRYAEDLNLTNITDFKGYIDNPEILSEIYCSADIFIMSSIDSEGLPRVIEEAQLHGLPVIATNNGGVPLLYENRENILLVPRQDAAALADAISEIVENVVLRQKLIRNGLAFAESRLTSKTAARQHAEVILGETL